MIEDNGLVFTNLNGQSWTWNNDTCPLTEFDPETEIFGTEVKRMQEPGIWPHRTILGKCLIHITFDILRDTSADFISDYLTLKNTLMPPGVVEMTRKMGVLKIQYVGQEWMQGDCALDGPLSMPFQALYPSVASGQLTFKIFRPYMTGIASGKLYSL